MTYCNVLLRPGYDEAAALLASAGVSGAILPDLALEELDDWQRSANAHGIEAVLLAAPSTPAARLDALCARSEGFLYAIGRMATTGETRGARSEGARAGRGAPRADERFRCASGSASLSPSRQRRSARSPMA